MNMKHRRLKKIPVGSSSESCHIKPRRTYRVRIARKWYEGAFSKRWFGWSFDGFGSSGMQLNLIEQVYEVLVAPRKRGKKENGF